MPLEKPSYRDNLERIKEFFPTKELLKTVERLFNFKDGYISVAKLAREMS